MEKLNNCPHCGSQLTSVSENAENFQCPSCLEVINIASPDADGAPMSFLVIFLYISAVFCGLSIFLLFFLLPFIGALTFPLALAFLSAAVILYYIAKYFSNLEKDIFDLKTQIKKIQETTEK